MAPSYNATEIISFRRQVVRASVTGSVGMAK